MLLFPVDLLSVGRHSRDSTITGQDTTADHRAEGNAGRTGHPEHRGRYPEPHHLISD